MMRTAIYPGSFDPLTNGHIDIIARAHEIFEMVTVAIADNPQKKHLFSIDERVAMAKQCVHHFKNVEVETFSGLMVEYAKQKKVRTVLRGLRAVSDFEYEFQLANMNRQLTKEVETVFMMTGEASFYVSSQLVREVASFGGDVSRMVPEPVFKALQKRFST